MKKFIFILVLAFFFIGTGILNSGNTQTIWTPAHQDRDLNFAPNEQFGWLPTKKEEQVLLDPTELRCLALNIYFEAAIESTAGKLAVAQVTLNRVNSNRFPSTICGVVYQGPTHADGFPKRDRCQFSWYCDGKHDTPNESPAWRESQRLAEYFMKHTAEFDFIDITDGATHYHANYIDPPRWANKRQRTVSIDTHIFYNKSRGRAGFNF